MLFYGPNALFLWIYFLECFFSWLFLSNVEIVKLNAAVLCQLGRIAGDMHTLVNFATAFRDDASVRPAVAAATQSSDNDDQTQSPGGLQANDN